jgi:hypothetical protein
MRLTIPLFALLLLGFPRLLAQAPSLGPVELAALSPTEAASDPLPDAPAPQSSSSDSTSATPNSSQNSAPPTQPDSKTARTDEANQQLKEQESQRLLGVVPQFNISYRSDAVSLTSKQKFSLVFHTVFDPVTFGTALVVAGYREALDDNIGFRWGPEGYFRRAGASYLDEFDGSIIGNAVLPSLLRQDPRYFRLGHGTVMHRILYSAATNVICKHDNTRKWEPNYSNILGNVAAGAISNLYYPSGTTGMGQTLTNGFVVTAEGALGSLFDEFWPDISRHVLHRDPTHGLDAGTPTPTPLPPPPK